MTKSLHVTPTSAWAYIGPPPQTKNIDDLSFRYTFQGGTPLRKDKRCFNKAMATHYLQTPDVKAVAESGRQVRGHVEERPARICQTSRKQMQGPKEEQGMTSLTTPSTNIAPVGCDLQDQFLSGRKGNAKGYP